MPRDRGGVLLVLLAGYGLYLVSKERAAAAAAAAVPQPGPLAPAVPLPTASTGIPEYGGGGADF